MSFGGMINFEYDQFRDVRTFVTVAYEMGNFNHRKSFSSESQHRSNSLWLVCHNYILSVSNSFLNLEIKIRKHILAIVKALQLL